MPESKYGAQQVDALFTKLEVGASAAVARELDSLTPGAPAVLHTLRARALQEEGRHEDAVEDFRQVLRQDPENPVARQFLVFSLFETGEVEEAGRLLSPEAGPVFPHPGFLLKFLETFWPLRFGTVLGAPRPGFEPPESPADKEESKAEAVLSSEGSGSAGARRAAERLQHKAVRLFRLGEHRTAHRYFYWAARLDPADGLIAAHHGYLCLLTGYAERALEVLEPVVEGLLERFGETRKAEDLPLPDTLVAYAWSLHEMGRHDEALRVLAAVYPEGPDDYAAHFVAAVCWLMLGQHEAMRRTFEVVTGNYFIDTWEQILHAFILHTGNWLREGAPGYAPRAGSGGMQGT